jgi:hypothetical protein
LVLDSRSDRGGDCDRCGILAAQPNYGISGATSDDKFAGGYYAGSSANNGTKAVTRCAEDEPTITLRILLLLPHRRRRAAAVLWVHSLAAWRAARLGNRAGAAACETSASRLGPDFLPERHGRVASDNPTQRYVRRS